MAIQLGARPVHSPVGRMPQPPRSRRADLILLRQGLDIALAYFNYGTREELPVLTARARIWSSKYYRGYRYAAKRATTLLRTFPHLFNLDIDAPLRLVPAQMAHQPGHPAAQGSSIRDHRRAERRDAGVEPFPDFAEPTLVSDAEVDEIVDLRPRQPPAGGRSKPIMRVDASLLRGSGLMESLPEFLGQLARANLETETRLATNPDGAGFELDEDTAAQQPHVEMNLYAGLVAETQRRRHARRIILPGGRPFRLPGDDDEDDEESGDEAAGAGASDADVEMADDSGNESDASTSTTASLRVNLKKRKARQISGSEDGEESVANKLRISYDHPPAVLAAFDMKRRELIRKLNPEDLGLDPFAALARQRAEKTPSSPASTSSSSSGGPTRIIKIKIPESMRSSARSSRAATPDSPSSSSSGTSKYGIIKLRDPRKTPSASCSPRPTSRDSASSQGSDSPGPRKTRIKLVGSTEARLNDKTA